MVFNKIKQHITKGVKIFHKKYYIYPGKKKGSLEITEGQKVSKDELEEYYGLQKCDDDEQFMNIHQEAVLQFTQKKYENALKLLKKVFRKKSSADWYTKANLLTNLGRDKEAIKCYDETLFLDTHYIKAWYRKGWTLARLGEYEKATECFENVMELEAHKKSKYVRDNWYFAAKFSLMLSMIWLNNKLVKEKKGSIEVSERVRELINEMFPLLATAILAGKDENGRDIWFETGFYTDDIHKFVDSCVINYKQILKGFEPPVTAEFKDFGQTYSIKILKGSDKNNPYYVK